MENLSRYKKRILIPAILALFLPVLLIQHNLDTKDDWSGISHFIKNDIQKDEGIIILAYYEAIPFSYYFSPECFTQINLTDCLHEEGVHPLKYVNDLEKIRYVNKTWLILSRTELEPESREILKLIYEDFEIKSKKKFRLNEDSKILDKFQFFLQKNDYRFFNEIEVQYLARKENHNKKA
jgi:hypothetical protein